MQGDDTSTKNEAPRTGPEPARPLARTQAEAPKRETPALAEGTRRPQATLPSFAAVSAPRIDTPKGGGALRGMGESFKMSAPTGTWSMSIPLPVTPSPRGLTPELGLSYDVGQGQGPFGLGWSLGVPQITRKTDKKLPEYRDSEDSDVFSLAGAEDLTPMFTLVAGTWTRHPTRYRPRVEGGFAKIERLATGDGHTYWRVQTRDNVTHTYGLTTDSRIADPTHSKRIFSWLLCKTQDDRGNVIVYRYKAEDLAGSPAGKPSEVHRKSGLSPVTANRYLKRVFYGNATPGDDTEANFRFELVFDYGDHAALTDRLETQTWGVRFDPFSSYRAGFEVRTYRLCRRVLMFHRGLPGVDALAATTNPVAPAHDLVRALQLQYDEGEQTRHVTKLTGATLSGHGRGLANALVSEALPSLSFSYTPDVISKRVRELEETAISTAKDFRPLALTRGAQWIDLDGDGLPGILIDRREALAYKRNLGGGKLAHARTLPSRPTLLGTGATQLLDLDGSGELAMVALSGSVRGYHRRIRAKGDAPSPGTDDWDSFVPLAHAPNVDWDDPNLRLIDLDGDGRDDILVSHTDHFEWWPSEGKTGWGPARTIPKPREEEKGAAVVFSGPFSKVYLADMSGDGLADIVRITHASVVYWPNLGHGKFGPMVTMDNAPTLGTPSGFDPTRARLADLDGTGTADLLYFDGKGMHIWRNEAGNAFGAEHLNDMVCPVSEVLNTLAILDVLGSGTSCITWITTSHGFPPLRYVDLFDGKKPNLLAEIHNGSGGTTKVTHTPSTKFYLEDRRAGKPWVTKLPFPVQVTEKVETIDHIAKTRIVSTYSYHHGHYDPEEREFRGFGRVDQLDTEWFDPSTGIGDLPALDIDPETGEARQKPAKIVTWFHTGSWRDRAAEAEQYATEYWKGDLQAVAIPAPALPSGLSPNDLKEACRALRGLPLRVEIYGLDGAPNQVKPFAVSQHTYEVRKLQPRVETLRGVFLPVDLETREYQYERDAADPRLIQSLALETDEYGTVTKSAVVAYARRGSAPNPPGPQYTSLCLVSELTVEHIDDSLDEPATFLGHRRLAIPTEGKTYQLTGFAGTPTAPTSATALAADFTGATAIAYHEPHTSGLQKRLVEHVKVKYYDTVSVPATPSPLANFGDVDPRAIPIESYQLDLTDVLLAQAIGDDLSATWGTIDFATLASEGGYQPDGTTYWIKSGTALPVVSQFYLPSTFTDAFGSSTDVDYDADFFLATQVEDALGNTVAAEHDYRLLAPKLITDPNGNRVAAGFDALGRVTAVAVMGKQGESDGDTLPAPTEAFQYKTDQWAESPPKPNYVKRTARETHGAGATAFQESYTYTDGSGRVAMVKAKVEPGPIPGGNNNTVSPRWLGSGKTVVNNKGNTIKQYEPFFSATSAYEDEEAMAEIGVTSVVTYDALSRPKRVDHPDGSFETSFWTPWQSDAWDRNDNDAGGPHEGTPTRTHTDVLGRPFLVQADLGSTASPRYLDTRTALDIEGQPLSVTDPKGRVCQSHLFSIGGRLLKENNLDKGSRWTFHDVAGAPIRRWDQRVQRFRFAYDAIRRPTHLWLSVTAGTEKLLERRYYGDAAGITDPHDENLRGQLILLFDQAGKVELGPFDFKANLEESRRTLAALPTLPTPYGAAVDWSALAAVTSAATAESTAAAQLEAETWLETREYDALNRITELTTPDLSEHVPTFNQSGLLESVQVAIRGASPTTFVESIDYNEKGQRTKIVYGNGTETTYQYDEKTFRLTRLITTRSSPSNTLQDLTFTHDPVGNILSIADAAQQLVYFDDDRVSADQEFEYDALYRLKRATGREHTSLTVSNVVGTDGAPLQNLPDPSNPQALRSYEETYTLDEVGNILSLFHDGGGGTGTWTRSYTYQRTTPDDCNWLSTTTGTGLNPYSYDAHGNMLTLPGVGALAYSPFDQMSHADLEGGGDAYYVYDAGGQRVRKIVVDNGGNLHKERIYLGAFEIYRERVVSPTPQVTFERRTLHVMDDPRRIAMVEWKTIDGGSPVTIVDRHRYQYTNHLGTAVLECDHAGAIISFEEMHPYGSSAYRSAPSTTEVSARRYRYTGKERDEETGLDYFSARYYAPWLGSWTTADPLGLQAGLNLYLYGRANPVVFVDPNGMEEIRVDVSESIRSFQTSVQQRAIQQGIPQERVKESLLTTQERRLPGDERTVLSEQRASGARETVLEARAERQRAAAEQRRKVAIAAYERFVRENPMHDPDNPLDNPEFNYFGRRPPPFAEWDGFNMDQVREGFWQTHSPRTSTSLLASITDFLTLTPGAAAGVQSSRAPQSFHWSDVRPTIQAQHSLPPGTPIHHWLIPQGGTGKLSIRGILREQWGRAVPDMIKNSRWNLMLPPQGARDPFWGRVWHEGVHGKGAAALGFGGRLWHGSPTWAKGAAVGVPITAGGVTYLTEP